MDFSGERGIRTPGTLQYIGFQDRRIRPLCHLSSANLTKDGKHLTENLFFLNFNLKFTVKTINTFNIINSVPLFF